MQAALPEGAQTHFRSIVTNGQLQVNGSGGSIYAIGDAATIEQVSALLDTQTLQAVPSLAPRAAGLMAVTGAWLAAMQLIWMAHIRACQCMAVLSWSHMLGLHRVMQICLQYPLLGLQPFSQPTTQCICHVRCTAGTVV